MMKKYILAACAAVLMMAASCQKSPYNGTETGYLSFGDFSLEVDDAVITKADAADGNYSINIINSDGNCIISKSYSEILGNDDKMSVPAGSYTLVASSSAGSVPDAAFENAIYGTSKEFTVEAGKVTTIGELVCTLVQCKVTVSYSDEFLAAVTGDGYTSVEVTAGKPLKYALNANGTYDQSAGYFAVSGTTMTVTFNGNIEGKSAKMTKIFTGIAAKQWRQIKFIQKKNEQGNAVFDIVIEDLISDETLDNDVEAEEDIIGEDPEKPKGDGGITLEFDYEAGCDEELTDFSNLLIVPVETRDMVIKLKATVPGGVKKFTVDIASDNEAFLASVDLANARHLDLINPTEDNMIIFEVVPFPYGQELLGKTEISFDLSNAQDAILLFKGTHTFTMTIVDNQGCSKQIPVTMIVE